MQTFQSIRNTAAKHSYDVEVMKDGMIGLVAVEANNRSQAASIVAKAGYEVRSVNMVG